MDLRGMLNDDGNLPPATPIKPRQASIVSPTPPSTAASQASRPSPIPKHSPAPLTLNQSPVPPSRPAQAPARRREPPNWAKRFDWAALQRGEHAPAPRVPSKNPIEVAHPHQQSAQQPPLAAPAQLPTLEPSLTNEKPYDELTRRVCDFFWDNIMSREDLLSAPPGIKIEIEGKLGTLIDRERNQRLQLPVMNQVVLGIPSDRLAFQSLMDERQHKKMNDFLNQEVAMSRRRGRSAIQYQHLRETDSFHVLGPDGIAHLPPVARGLMAGVGHHRKPRVRVTRDTKTGVLKNQIVKARIADLDIYSPMETFDCRISINAEITFPEDVSGFDQLDEPPRVKDRMSYLHQHTQVDLTQVHGSNGKVHELEVEMLTDKLIEHGLLTQAGKENQYEDLVAGFVNNIRLLAREATF